MQEQVQLLEVDQEDQPVQVINERISDKNVQKHPGRKHQRLKQLKQDNFQEEKFISQKKWTAETEKSPKEQTRHSENPVQPKEGEIGEEEEPAEQREAIINNTKEQEVDIVEEQNEQDVEIIHDGGLLPRETGQTAAQLEETGNRPEQLGNIFLNHTSRKLEKEKEKIRFQENLTLLEATEREPK